MVKQLIAHGNYIVQTVCSQLDIYCTSECIDSTIIPICPYSVSLQPNNTNEKCNITLTALSFSRTKSQPLLLWSYSITGIILFPVAVFSLQMLLQI